MELEIVFETRSELVLKDGASVGNIHSSLDFVTGSSLRGALAARWLEERPADERFLDLFERQVMVGDATPATDCEARTFPIPRSIQRCKASCPNPTVVDRLAEGLDPGLGAEPFCGHCGGGYAPTAGYISQDGTLVSVPLRPRGQTANDEDGTAAHESLRYRDTIPKGTKFVSCIRGHRKKVEAFLDGSRLDEGSRLRVGESRSTRGSLEVTKIRWQEPRECDELEVAIVLCSRAIMLDPWLRPTTRVIAEADDRLAIEHPLTVQPLKWAGPLTPVAGWNGGQGIPKPTDQAVPAGSTFAFMLENGAAIRSQGVGVRRAEGFGEVQLIGASQHAELAAAVAKEGGERS